MIDAPRVFIGMSGSRCGRRKVVYQRAAGRSGPIGTACDAGRNLVHQSRRNDIARDRISNIARLRSNQARRRVNHASRNRSGAKRIINCPAQDWSSESVGLSRGWPKQRGKISRPFRRSRHCANEGGGCCLLQAFIVGKKVSLVFPDWAPNGGAVLIAVKRRLCSIIKEVPRIHCTVAVELPGIPVESIGSRFGYHVDHISAAPSILRCKRVGLNLKLLHVVHRRNVDHPSPVDARVVGAIQ